jgi:tRNA(adenine34) deaminase
LNFNCFDMADHAQLNNQNSNTRNSSDSFWMERALAEAAAAGSAGEVPVGAVVVKDGELIAAGQNRNLRDHDASAHAEVVALRAAGASLGNHRLEGCEMYVIIEPCAMCAGALVHARLKRLIYGAKDPKAGAVESVMQVVNHPRLNHRMEVTGGVLAERCAATLREFFRERRETSLPAKE